VTPHIFLVAWKGIDVGCRPSKDCNWEKWVPTADGTPLRPGEFHWFSTLSLTGLWDIFDMIICIVIHTGTVFLFVSGKAMTEAHFGEGRGPIWLDEVDCQGNEAHIINCQAEDWGSTNCDHSEDAGVICSDVDTAVTSRPIPKPTCKYSLDPSNSDHFTSSPETLTISQLGQWSADHAKPICPF
jgi:hypothetical protein